MLIPWKRNRAFLARVATIVVATLLGCGSRESAVPTSTLTLTPTSMPILISRPTAYDVARPAARNHRGRRGVKVHPLFPHRHRQRGRVDTSRVHVRIVDRMRGNPAESLEAMLDPTS